MANGNRKGTITAYGLKAAVKAGIWKASPRILERFQTPATQEFSIGIYTGASLAQLAPAADIANPVLTRRDVSDVPATLVADPFLCRTPQRWYMFFEVIDAITRKGVIAVAGSDDGLRWHYDRVVLEEKFHLSYPHVFAWGGSYYMIPETGEDRCVRLYRAAKFPHRWKLVSTLLEDASFVDSSIFRWRDCWWLFTGTSTSQDEQSAALHLFYADELHGPWHEHPANPIVDSSVSIARPAGRVVLCDGRPVRFAQSGYPDYGTEVHAFSLTELSRSRYAEEPLHTGLLEPGAQSWNSGGMHHLDAHLLPDGTWLASVDGWKKNPG